MVLPGVERLLLVLNIKLATLSWISATPSGSSEWDIQESSAPLPWRKGGGGAVEQWPPIQSQELSLNCSVLLIQEAGILQLGQCPL
jgi:hypothetical protein